MSYEGIPQNEISGQMIRFPKHCKVEHWSCRLGDLIGPTYTTSINNNKFLYNRIKIMF